MTVSKILNTFARVMGPRLQTTKAIGKSGTDSSLQALGISMLIVRFVVQNDNNFKSATLWFLFTALVRTMGNN